MARLFRILTFLTIAVLSARAQVSNFRSYGRDDGFPESPVSAIQQDQRGDLWIGTLGKGLVRFNSHQFFFYGEEMGLMRDSIYTIAGDRSGNLWLGTQRGIYIYDGRNFSPFKYLSSEAITAILTDNAGNVWIGTANSGLYRYDGKGITPFRTTLKGLVDKAINCLYADRRSNLWIGTPNGVGRYGGQQFKFFANEPGLPSNAIHAIAEDLSGDLWFATESGLGKFDGKEFTSYSDLASGAWREVSAVMVDEKNNLWSGTFAGIMKYDGKKFQRYDLSDGQGRISVVCNYKDVEGNLWFGTSEGLTRLDSERFTLYPQNDQMGQRVHAIVEAISGNILCGTSLGGTTVFDGQHYSLVDRHEGFTSSIVQCFYYSPDSSLWIGTHDDGIYKFSKSGTLHYTREEGLPVNNITGFVVDSLQNLWITSADSGVVVTTTLNDSLHVIKRYTTRTGLSGNRINGIAYDGEAIWLGTADGEINKIRVDGQPDSSANVFARGHGVIHSIITDSLRRVYVASSQGIRVYDREKFHSLTRAQGLSSNTVYSLVIDRQGNLWAGTEDGVDMIPLSENISPGAIRHFGADEGFRGVEVYRNASCVDRKGNIWFGTINGLVKYSPAEDLKSRTPPKINITGIKLFFDNIEDTPYGDSVSAWFPIPVALELPYDQNNLTFSFAGVYHRNPHAVRYKWMLEGFSKDWSPPLSEQQAIFSNVPPGDYTFKVVACNEDNIWSAEPASFRFSITPPVWQRWWFKIGAVAVLVLLIWMIFYARLRRIQEKNRVIQERLEMEKSILELEQEAARLQMNPHFIFNCLNSIQGFISTNDPFKAKKYLAKFARLMRLILENAREEFIPLQNEINILENYIELEKLSTQQSFDFSITHDPSIDPEQIQIPPMIIQPFVENAIIHGLRKKESNGAIAIHFKPGEEVLICTIRDNGIGRKQSAQINGATRSQHKSAAIPITQKRLEQYGAYRKVNAGIQIIDLEEEGKPAGTEVVVVTPYELL